MLNKRIQLTQRDLEILHFINEFDFCEMSHLIQKFNIEKPIGYRLMRRLIKAELVVHQRVFHFQSGIYYLTTAGAKCTDLPPIASFVIGRYKHQRKLIDVYLKLHQRYPQAEWISERRLKHEKFYDGVGKNGHLSDGILILEDKKIAIEVELNLKGKQRLKNIFKHYSSQFDFHEVWYFCPKEMVAPLKALLEDNFFIKIFDMAENLV